MDNIRYAVRVFAFRNNNIACIKYKKREVERFGYNKSYWIFIVKKIKI